MKGRIVSPYAYGQGPVRNCFWRETASVEARAFLSGAAQADIAIIGAGFTGLSAALHLAEAGADVVVLEANQPGWGASGRNGGFCCLGGSKASDTFLRRAHGADEQNTYRMAEKAAVDLVAGLLERHGIEADTHSRGETMLAHSPRAFAAMREEADGLEKLYGVVPELIEKSELAAHGLNGSFHGGMTNPLGFGLNPLKYVSGLATAAEKAGVRVFGDSPVEQMLPTGDGYRLKTQAGEVQAKRVIIATNGYSSDALPDWMAGRYMPVASNVIVTRVLSEAEKAAQGWTSDQMAYDSRALLHYFRLMPDGRFLFGMRGGILQSQQSEAGLRRRIRRDFERMFPAWANVETPWFWTGLLCLAPSLTPFAGEVPGQPGLFAGFAYHGNGVAMGSYVGRGLADRVLGRTPDYPWPDFFGNPPGRFPGGRARRALLIPAYLGYAVSDWLG